MNIEWAETGCRKRRREENIWGMLDTQVALLWGSLLYSSLAASVSLSNHQIDSPLLRWRALLLVAHSSCRLYPSIAGWLLTVYIYGSSGFGPNLLVAPDRVFVFRAGGQSSSRLLSSSVRPPYTVSFSWYCTYYINLVLYLVLSDFDFCLYCSTSYRHIEMHRPDSSASRVAVKLPFLRTYCSIAHCTLRYVTLRK